ncbi:hypothetical protein KIH74_14835 [Kineosporia sp. J2-2]|uniref:DUF4352 domain-containing protein n=1 Tax=Kineosporia corallincola TaxID=2835133 RepID=A0ABS5TKU9_9ACTN|nr:hypothetical protein [Kineosporia corallincola]MBT0770214.1 hypothetical protein [Kineosporia corallincola]
MFVSVCLIVVTTLVTVGVMTRLGDRPTSPSGSTVSTTSPSTPATGAEQHGTGWASAELAVTGNIGATVYFGRLEDVLGHLGGKVTFAVGPGYRSTYPDACVVTVVFTNVRGTTAKAYALDLYSSWLAAESTPDPAVSADHGTVHHQMVTPPRTVTPGTRWTPSSMIDVDGAQITTGTYSLELLARRGSRLTWALGSRQLTCSLT